MSKHTLNAQKRIVYGRKVKAIRSQGLVSASVYGKKTPTLSLQLSAKDFLKLFTQVGESTLIYLNVESEKEPRPVLVSETTYHPVTQSLINVSFHQVDLKEKVTAPVSIVMAGESPAVKDKLGILVQQLDEVEIEALPTDMPEHITIDLSSLLEVNSQITIADLKLNSSKLSVKSDPETIIVKIEALAKEEVKEVAPVETMPVETTATPETTTEAA